MLQFVAVCGVHSLLSAWISLVHMDIGVRAGGARGAAAPPNFGQLRFFGQQEKIWAKPGFKDVSYFEDISIFYFNLKKKT